MVIITYIACLLSGYLISLLWKPSPPIVKQLARIYLWLALILVFSTAILFFAGIKNLAILDILHKELTWSSNLSHLILGYLLGNLIPEFKNISDDVGSFRPILNSTIWGAGIAFGCTFLLFTVGKCIHLPMMIDFFKQSGYAIWFLYFIMAAETIGTIGILTHFKWKMGIPATIGLLLIMLGAIYTHRHNEDPLSDSYDAISQLISGSILILLYVLERRSGHR